MNMTFMSSCCCSIARTVPTCISAAQFSHNCIISASLSLYPTSVASNFLTQPINTSSRAAHTPSAAEAHIQAAVHQPRTSTAQHHTHRDTPDGRSSSSPVARGGGLYGCGVRRGGIRRVSRRGCGGDDGVLRARNCGGCCSRDSSGWVLRVANGALRALL